VQRVAAEEQLIASIKSKTADYKPINYYEAFLKYQLDILSQSGQTIKLNHKFLKNIFYDDWLALPPATKESFRNSIIEENIP